MKDYDASIKDYDEVIRLDPKFAPPYNYRGFTKHLRLDYAGAIADYDEAIRLDPKYASARSNKAFLLSTAEDASLRNPDQALKLADDVPKEDSKNPYAINAKFGTPRVFDGRGA